MNLLITGSNGQLGSEFEVLSQSETNFNFILVTRDQLDITSKEDMNKMVQEKEIDFIINCAGYTAVDKAEEEVDQCDQVNHYAVKVMAEVCKENGCGLIHISTDYVFNGESFTPYIETDKTSPQSVYGRTKLAGEEALIAQDLTRSVIIRTSWVYSSFGNNFVKTMLKLGKQRDQLNVIFDQVGTPTYAKDLARAILDMIPQIKNEKSEIFHFSNEGVVSWYDFAQEIMSMAQLECQISPIETADYPTAAKRPHFSLLNKKKIKESFDISIPYWKESLKECLIKLGEYKK